MIHIHKHVYIQFPAVVFHSHVITRLHANNNLLVDGLPKVNVSTTPNYKQMTPAIVP